MSDLVERVIAAIEREQLLPSGARVLVAVSGGGDSVVLLHLLQSFRASRGWTLEVAHFNHGLRGREASRDERWVRRLAEGLGIPCHCGRGDVRGWAAREGCSIEMAARVLRHEFLARTAVDRGMGRIALGHHADDQVETLFLRLLRGAAGVGVAGLAWIAPSPANHDLRLIRPLLDCPRAVLHDFALSEGLAWREDATNRRLDALRNRIRNELLPLLEGGYQPAFQKVARRFMEVTGADADFVALTARAWLAGEADGAFDGLHRAVQRQVVLQQLHRISVAPDFALVESLIARPRHPVQVNRTLRVWREASGRLATDHPTVRTFSDQSLMVDLAAGAGQVEFNGLRLRWSSPGQVPVGCRRRDAEAQVEWFDAGVLGPRVTLRHWRPGDRFQPIGMSAPVKLQDLFVNARVPREERPGRVLGEAASGGLFWVEGLRIGELAKIRSETRRAIRWSWEALSPGGRSPETARQSET
ncbi:MAG: tRNA lysidine(34) synthetase TilS [Verrucomicrobiales bacterium]|nr:tRNA lysidine(34) synthetase TilS [Verrucomicrobiales bacterium]